MVKAYVVPRGGVAALGGAEGEAALDWDFPHENGTFTLFCDSGISTDLWTISPGASCVPANALPSIAQSPPKRPATATASRIRPSAADPPNPANQT